MQVIAFFKRWIYCGYKHILQIRMVFEMGDIWVQQGGRLVPGKAPELTNGKPITEGQKKVAMNAMRNAVAGTGSWISKGKNGAILLYVPVNASANSTVDKVNDALLKNFNGSSGIKLSGSVAINGQEYSIYTVSLDPPLVPKQ